jgi:hypothetical protein
VAVPSRFSSLSQINFLVCVVVNKRLLISDMLEVPKVKSTTSYPKGYEGTAVMSLPNGKNDLNVTMDNPQTSPTTAMIRLW